MGEDLAAAVAARWRQRLGALAPSTSTGTRPNRMERTNRAFRERGGYSRSLRPDGGDSWTFPSLSSGERPLDEGRR